LIIEFDAKAMHMLQMDVHLETLAKCEANWEKDQASEDIQHESTNVMRVFGSESIIFKSWLVDQPKKSFCTRSSEENVGRIEWDTTDCNDCENGRKEDQLDVIQNSCDVQKAKDE